jgi:hypothetical protein
MAILVTAVAIATNKANNTSSYFMIYLICMWLLERTFMLLFNIEVVLLVRQEGGN